MDPRRRASLLWGVVGGLSFLVLIQGYELWAAEPVDPLVKLVVTVAVGLGAAVLAHLGARRLRENGRV